MWIVICLLILVVSFITLGLILPTPTSGASMFGVTGQFVQMPDGSLVNLNMAQRISQDSANVILELPTGNIVRMPYGSAALAAAALSGFTDFLTAQFGLLTLRSITPATAAALSTVNAVLLGTGFQYDIMTGTFLGTITVGGNATTATYVNSNTILLQFTAPNPAGSYDVVYKPNVGSSVTLTNGWTST